MKQKPYHCLADSAITLHERFITRGGMSTLEQETPKHVTQSC